MITVFLPCRLGSERIPNKNTKNFSENFIYSNDSTYSSLSLFEIVNENVETDDEKIIKLFEHVLENNKFDKETKNLIILKKAIFETNFTDEQKMLTTIKPLINNLNPNAIILLFTGGISYTLGLIFYAWNSLPYNHGIWHIFVMIGSFTHFFAVLFYVIPLVGGGGA